MVFPPPCIQQLFSFIYKAPSPPVKTVLSALSRGIIGANRLIVARFSNVSPVENKDDLELDFKVFFFTDSCCSDIVHDESK